MIMNQQIHCVSTSPASQVNQGATTGSAGIATQNSQHQVCIPETINSAPTLGSGLAVRTPGNALILLGQALAYSSAP